MCWPAPTVTQPHLLKCMQICRAMRRSSLGAWSHLLQALIHDASDGDGLFQRIQWRLEEPLEEAVLDMPRLKHHPLAIWVAHCRTRFSPRMVREILQRKLEDLCALLRPTT